MIDHRSYHRQGIEQLPTIHMGASASQMEKRGIATERGNRNRSIEVSNQEIRQLRARIKKVKTWLYAQPLNDAPTLVEMKSGIADGNNLTARWQKIADLRAMPKVLIFLQSNGITDVSQLAEKITQTHTRLYDMSKDIQAVDRRLETLAQHFTQYENCKKHKAIYQKYQHVDGKKGDAFYDKYFEEIQLYEGAVKYLKAVLNGRKTVPTKAWLAEQ